MQMQTRLQKLISSTPAGRCSGAVLSEHWEADYQAADASSGQIMLYEKVSDACGMVFNCSFVGSSAGVVLATLEHIRACEAEWKENGLVC